MLLLVSGASGVGKSTVRWLLADRLGPEVESVELHDLAEVPDVPTVRWRQQTAEVAVRRAAELADHGRHLLLANDPVAPGEVLAAPSADEVDVAACLLDADPPAQTARLRGRGEPDELLDAHLAFAAWLRGHARDPGHAPEVLTIDGWEAMRWDHLAGLARGGAGWKVPVVDSSRLTPVEAADEVAAWVRAATEGRAHVLRAGRHRSTDPA